MSGLARQVVDLLGVYRFSYQHERDLQDGVEEVLAGAGLDFRREHRFTQQDVVDFLVGDVALECKVAGGLNEVLRQLRRYAEQQDVAAVVLLTSRAHHRPPATLAGKPVLVVHLGGLA